MPSSFTSSKIIYYLNKHNLFKKNYKIAHLLKKTGKTIFLLEILIIISFPGHKKMQIMTDIIE